MNTIETERLVRRIVATLKGDGGPTMASLLAAEFQEVSNSVQIRLEQCRSMITAGSSMQAIELAETAPNLMDLVTILEFKQADEWRKYCRTKTLPFAEALSTRAIAALNECYNKGITPQHSVYKTYREAVLRRDDAAAFVALKSIVRLNPKDSNAVTERARMDAKLLGIRLEKLDAYLKNNPEEALLELDNIESFGFKTELSGEIWSRGQLLRSERMLSDAENMSRQGLLAETASQLAYLSQLRSDYALSWPPSWESRARTLQSWCDAETATRQRDAEFKAALDDLSRGILASEEKDRSAPKSTIDELRADREDLQRRYHNLEKFSRQIASDLTQHFEKRIGIIQEKIERLARTRTLLLRATGIICFLVLALTVVVAAKLYRSSSLTAQLKKNTTGHQVRALESLLKQVGDKSIIATAGLKTASAAAAGEISSQLLRLKEFNETMGQLPRELTSKTTIDQFVDVLRLFNRAEQAHSELSPDLQAETKPELTSYRGLLRAQCEAELISINSEMDQQLTPMESQENQLITAPDLKGFRSILANILPKSEEASTDAATLKPFFNLRPELIDRSQKLLERLRRNQTLLSKLDANVAKLANANTIETIASTVSDLASVEIRQSDYMQAARKAGAVIALRNNPEALQKALIMGTNAGGMESFTNVLKGGNLTPKKLKDEVYDSYADMASDYSIKSKYYRCRLFHDEQLTRPEEWITAGPLANAGKWDFAYIWVVKNDGVCKFKYMQYGGFDGNYFFADRKQAYGMTITDISDLTDVWRSSGFATLVDTKTRTYKLPPLKVVDGIFENKTSSPILRAYLLNKLTTFMALQPMESGLNFAPQLRAMSVALHSMGVDSLSSGDWFVPACVTANASKYKQFFDSRPNVSFFKQASGLLSATASAAKSGFTLAGYVAPDGKPIWKSSPGDNYIWGLSEMDSTPALLFVVRNNVIRTVAKPMPLSPLLVYQGNLSALISESGLQADNPSIQSDLPPLFRATFLTP